MEEIKYHPLLDNDTTGTEKVPMFAVTDLKTVTAHHNLYLEEIVQNSFRLCSVKGDSNDEYLHYNIQCPSCGKVMKRISNKSDRYRLGLYICNECKN